jgi:hypothetical protein
MNDGYGISLKYGIPWPEQKALEEVQMSLLQSRLNLIKEYFFCFTVVHSNFHFCSTLYFLQVSPWKLKVRYGSLYESIIIVFDDLLLIQRDSKIKPKAKIDKFQKQKLIDSNEVL